MSVGKIVTEKIQHSSIDGTERLVARVAKKELWIELTGGRLQSSTAGWASFSLFPAISTGEEIEIVGELPPDATWQRGLAHVYALLGKWWNTGTTRVFGTRLPTLKERFFKKRKPKQRALFFSGGVDSFHALEMLRSQGRAPHALIFVEGFDVDHREEARFEQYRPALQQICDAYGVQLLRMRTNLRRMPFFREYNWEKTHGLAMAGVAHFLRDYGEIYIASSYQNRDDIPYGSRWDLDPHFSSRTHQFYHIGENLLRKTKIQIIEKSPIVRQHLRVCWEGNEARVNCGQCEKCLRTILLLIINQEIQHFPGFQHPIPLIERLDQVTPKFEPMMEMWRATMGETLEPGLDQALRRLIHRTLTAHPLIPQDFEHVMQDVQQAADYAGYTAPLVIGAPRA
jgi:hypothetical protein